MLPLLELFRARALFSRANMNASADLAETRQIQGILLTAPEQLFDVGELKFHISRPAVIALARERRRFHLA